MVYFPFTIYILVEFLLAPFISFLSVQNNQKHNIKTKLYNISPMFNIRSKYFELFEKYPSREQNLYPWHAVPKLHVQGNQADNQQMNFAQKIGNIIWSVMQTAQQNRAQVKCSFSGRTLAMYAKDLGSILGLSIFRSVGIIRVVILILLISMILLKIIVSLSLGLSIRLCVI